jgi:bacillithiol biosynthesis cysteine-adding enzyme BshC
LDKNFQLQYIPYSQTGKFTSIVLDYIDQNPELKSFYEHPVSLAGIESAIAERKKFNTNRKLLVEQLRLQYEGVDDAEKIKNNIDSILSEDTFTVCTAHQPNICTGHLYFVYKILHIIKLADSLKKKLPQYHFVPVFFIGSEDADLEELNHVVIDGEKYVWETAQKGAVGRMKVDDKLIRLIEKIAGRLFAEKYGSEIIALINVCFRKNISIEEATFLFVHHLFKDFGLIVLRPDNAAYKREMLYIFEDDIFNHTSSEIVSNTSERLALKYKAQAYPREINLFYLKDDLRSRIIPVEDHFAVHDTEITFSKDEIKKELREHPERFSPNVILRGLFQEIILPDVAWIGGGGELAYWLQLKDMFNNYAVPYPVLFVRNSFLIVEEKFMNLLKKMSLEPVDLFRGEEILFNEAVTNKTQSVLSLDDEKLRFQEIYKKIKNITSQIDITLSRHTDALETKHMKSLTVLEKKMLRAEKRKFADEKRQLSRLFSALFPEGNLQERTENFMLFYSKWGSDFFKTLYDGSLTFEQQFAILKAGIEDL